MPGELFVIATPIGNLEDITFRAVRILKEADIIAAEDTRRTSKLLNHYDIKNKLTIYNDYNKKKKTTSLINLLKIGNSIALVSDAGTPGISDPGFYLVRECLKQGINIVPVPGANAAITALSASGAATDSFTFYGFLPKKKNKKSEFIRSLKEKDNTIMLYESPYRIKETVSAIAKVMPERSIMLARELTKKFEEFIRGNAKKVNKQIKDSAIKGEFVLIIDKKEK